MNVLILEHERGDVASLVADVLGSLGDMQQTTQPRRIGPCRVGLCRSAQHPCLHGHLHAVEPFLHRPHLASERQVMQHECRVGQPDRRFRQVLHLDERVHGSVEVAEHLLFIGFGRIPALHGRQLSQPHDARRVATHEQHVARLHDAVAADVGQPVAASLDGYDAHADSHRQLHVAQRPVGQVTAFRHDQPMRNLGCLRQVHDERPGDSQVMQHDLGDVDRSIGDLLDRRHHLKHRAHAVDLARVTHSQHRQRSHLVHEGRHVLLEAQDGIGHALVVEIERGVGQIDHELGGVLGLGEHGFQISRFVFRV